MNDEKMNLDDVIAKTMDALTATGLQYGSLQCYWKFFVQIKKFSYEVHGTRMYDPAVIEQYLQWKKEQYDSGENGRGMYTQACRAMKILVEYACGGVITAKYDRKGTPFQLQETFENMLQEYLCERQFQENTRADVSWAIRRFLDYLEKSGHYSLDCINEEHVRKYLIAMSDRLSRGSLKNMICYLKAFAEFAYRKEYVSFDMTPLLSIKIRRPNKIYPILTDSELERILAQVDTTTILGKRDMAMLQIAITTGLRSIDIVNLQLQDIDWMRGEIRLIQRKTLIPVILPLMQEAGAAIKEYILHARPQSQSQYIFLTVTSPYRKLADDTTFGYMFTSYQQKAGISRQPFDGKSFHALRRRIATKMVTSGVPITTISQVLGQVNTESTKQYLSFHSEQLRECALSLDEIAWKEDMFNV